MENNEKFISKNSIEKFKTICGHCKEIGITEMELQQFLYTLDSDYIKKYGDVISLDKKDIIDIEREIKPLNTTKLSNTFLARFKDIMLRNFSNDTTNEVNIDGVLSELVLFHNTKIVCEIERLKKMMI